MGLLFWDGFNHYDTLTDKWDFAFSGVIVSGVARTGTQSVQVIGGNNGPAKNLSFQQQATNYSKLIQGVGLRSDGITANQDVILFNIVDVSVLTPNVKVTLNTDGSFSVFRGAGDTAQALLGTSAAGLFQFNSDWNYLECKWFGDPAAGSVELRFSPPGGPCTIILTISGVKTVAFTSNPYCNQVQVSTSGNLAHNNYLADYYLLDWSNPADLRNDYQGGVKIYHEMPFDNGVPVDFTPLAGQNFQNVDAVPPNTSTYNSSSTVGAIDQYQHNDTGVPANSSILAVQHIMDADVDAGARAITSVVEGVAHTNSVYLGNGFAMFTYPYDENPATSAAWVGADFPASFGPEVTV